MPRGGPRPGAGRPKGSKNKKAVKSDPKPKSKAKNKSLMPLDYMLDIMRDEDEPKDRRDKMAYWLLPYLYPKADKKTGKKEEREERAKAASTGRFSASQPPQLRSVK